MARTRRAHSLFRGQQGQGRLASVGDHGAHSIHDIDDARTRAKFTALGLISPRGMLVEIDLMIVCVALPVNGARLPVHLLVKVVQLLGHQMK